MWTPEYYTYIELLSIGKKERKKRGEKYMEEGKKKKGKAKDESKKE